MRVTVTIDGTPIEKDVSFESLTLQESCDVEETLGTDRFDAYQSGRVTPIVLRAVLWAKLRKEFPDLTTDDFDVDLLGLDDEGKAGNTDEG